MKFSMIFSLFGVALLNSVMDSADDSQTAAASPSTLRGRKLASAAPAEEDMDHSLQTLGENPERKLSEFDDCEVVDACNPGTFRGKRWTCWNNHRVRAGAGQDCEDGWVECKYGANPGIWGGRHWVCQESRYLQTGRRCDWVDYYEWQNQCNLRLDENHEP